MVQRRRRTVPGGANPRGKPERPHLPVPLIGQHPLTGPPELGRRIFELVYDQPFEEAIPSLGMVIVCLLLAETRDPVEAADAFAVLLRQLVADARRKGSDDATSLN